MISLNLIQIFAVLFFSSFNSLLMVGIMRLIAIRFQVLDRPDPLRKIQKNPVPYLGGVGIMISVLICLVFSLSF